jgi:hypothetical protein
MESSRFFRIIEVALAQLLAKRQEEITWWYLVVVMQSSRNAIQSSRPLCQSEAKAERPASQSGGAVQLT